MMGFHQGTTLQALSQSENGTQNYNQENMMDTTKTKLFLQMLFWNLEDVPCGNPTKTWS